MSTLEVTNPGGFQERMATVIKNMTDLSPIGEDLKRNALDFNQKRALAGVDANGNPLAPLKSSTLENRQGSGPPLAPNGAGSGIVTQCRVEVENRTAAIVLKKSWPGLRWLRHAIAGNANTPPRDPTGFSEEEMRRVGEILTTHINKKS